MTLWRRSRSELAGAWRSLRYDLGRRPAQPPPGGPDVTSTGMSTFGGRFPQEPPAGAGPRRRAARRAPRKAVAVTGAGALALAGAAGVYLALANGLGEHAEPAAADTFAVSAPAVPGRARQGLGSVHRPRAVPTVPQPVPATAVPPAMRQAPPAVAPVAAVPPRAAGGATAVPAHAASPSACGLCAPPMPTPTAPSGVPSPTSADPSPSPSEPGTSPSASPSPSADPTESPRSRHRRRRHH